MNEKDKPEEKREKGKNPPVWTEREAPKTPWKERTLPDEPKGPKPKP